MTPDGHYTSPQPERSALLTIDVQEDFAAPGAPAEIAGTAACLPAMGRVLEAYRKRGLPVVHVVRLYLEDGSNADVSRREAIERGARIVTPESHGAELAAPLKPNPEFRLDAARLLSGNLQELGPDEWVMYKPRWDAFHGTPLLWHLRRLGVNTVVVAGCNFPNCPRATIYGASMRDFRIVLVTDAVSECTRKGSRNCAASVRR